MKKTLLTVMLLCICFTLKAQNTFPTTGNVGIGTTSPQVKLDVRGVVSIGQTNSSFPFKMWAAGSGSLNHLRIGTDYGHYGDAVMELYQNYTGGNQQNPGKLIVNGNLGVGTSTPSAKLHVDNGNNSYGTILANADEKSFSLYTKTLNTNVYSESFRLGLKYNSDENNGFISFFRGGDTYGGFLGFSTNGIERIRVDQNGNVGIGTTTPDAKLEIVDQNASLRIRSTDPSNNSTLKLDWGVNHGHHISYNPNTAVTYFDSKHNTESNNVYSDVLFRRSVNNIMSPTFVIKGYTGNVGIGTTTPDAKLAVNGKIHTKEVKVDLVGWPDYVFKKEYQLPTLKEVEKHIKEKGHLKDIPSEKEVLKNGIQLGKMNARLLKKIEELTLYTIAQEKKIKQQEKEIKDLKKLSIRLTKIEALLKNK